MQTTAFATRSTSKVQQIRSENVTLTTVQCGKNAGAKNTQRGETPHLVEMICERGDFVYSAQRDLVGVVRSVDAKRGTADIYLGAGTFRFYQAHGELVRPTLDGKVGTYVWERLTVLRDEE